MEDGIVADHNAPEVGFVVIGRNEGERLRACLRSIEPVCRTIVYVDSRSDDDSVEIARSFGTRIVELGADDFLTAASGRTAGLKVLRTSFPGCSYVHFIDGDCVLQPDWLDHALEFISKNDRAAVTCGTRFEARPDDSIYNTILNEEWNTPPGLIASCGGDALMRVSALDAVGSFRPELKSCEEPELCARLRAAGWQVWRLSIPMTEHDAAMSRLSQWWKRGTRAGFGYVQVWRLSNSSGDRLNSRELISTFFWALAVPSFAIAGSLSMRSPLPAATALGLYMLQLSRMAAKRGLLHKSSWQRAMLFLVGKFAAAWGATSCLLGSHRQQTSYR